MVSMLWSLLPAGHFGSIQLTLMYDERKAELTVTVHSCKVRKCVLWAHSAGFVFLYKCRYQET